ncbi:MAG: DUF4340 domain-containing protein [Deltaproteobacteria bacterium]|nr:DUF4340 domain-containing protein [Deltaproteobacteria bacterium]
MRLGKHIVLALVLVALAGYYLYFDVVKKEQQQQAEEEAKKVFSLDAEAVDELALVRPQEAEILLVKKEDKTWSVKAPVQGQADSMEAEELIGRLRELSRVKTITEEAEDLTPFELDHPDLEVRFHTSAGWKSLLVGSKSPVGSEFYAKVSDQHLVFLITGADRSVLDKKLFDVRDKQLFRCETDQVDGIDFEKGDFRADVARNESGLWTVAGHEGVRISKNKLDDVIRDFCWSRVREFVQEDDKGLDQYALDSPTTWVKLSRTSGQQTLFLGKTKSDDSVYARLDGHPGVVALEARLLDIIPASLSAIEDRTLVSFDKESVAEVSWTQAEESFVLAKRPGDDKNKDYAWEFQAPESLKGRTLDAWKLDSQFYRIEGLEYVRKLDVTSSALPKATMDLILKGEGKTILVSMHLGPPVEKQEERMVWTDRDGGVQVYAVPQDKVDEIASRMEEMESKTP